MTRTHARSAVAALLLAATLAAAAGPTHASQHAAITVHKSRLCGCCNGWVAVGKDTTWVYARHEPRR